MRLNLLEKCLLKAAQTDDFLDSLHLCSNTNIRQEVAEMIWDIYKQRNTCKVLDIWKRLGHVYSLEFIEQNSDRPWDWGDISYNKRITEDFILRHKDIEFFETGIMRNANISVNFIFQNLDLQNVSATLNYLDSFEDVSSKRLIEFYMISGRKFQPKRFLLKNFPKISDDENETEVFDENEMNYIMTNFYIENYYKKFGEEETLAFVQKWQHILTICQFDQIPIELNEKMYNLTDGKIFLTNAPVSREFYETHSSINNNRIIGIDLNWIKEHQGDPKISQITKNWLTFDIDQQDLSFLLNFQPYTKKLVQYRRQLKTKILSAKKAAPILRKMKPEDMLSEEDMEFITKNLFYIELYGEIKFDDLFRNRDFGAKFLISLYKRNIISIKHIRDRKMTQQEFLECVAEIPNFREKHTIKRIVGITEDFFFNYLTDDERRLENFTDREFGPESRFEFFTEKIIETIYTNQDIDEIEVLSFDFNINLNFYRQKGTLKASVDYLRSRFRPFYEVQPVETFDPQMCYRYFSNIRYPYLNKFLTENKPVRIINDLVVYDSEEIIENLDNYINDSNFRDENNSHYIPIDLMNLILDKMDDQ